MYLIFNDKNILEYCSKNRPKNKVYIEANSDYDPSKKYRLENDKLVDITDEYIIKSMQTDEYIDELISSKYKQRFNDAEAFSTLSLFLSKQESKNFDIGAFIKEVVEGYYLHNKPINEFIQDKTFYFEFKKLCKVALRKYWIKLIYDEKNKSIIENRKPKYYPYPTNENIFYVESEIND